MTFIDSPIARCEAVREMVLLDETQAECAREHDCPPGRICPLDGCFTAVSGIAEEHLAAVAKAHPHSAAGATQGGSA
ncbi:hypothetical protein [Azoarcus olearius]|uniref:Uncharacterized protein n=1 Tax=Azoarcus sp. (strain BH72) TaxID=418699 RepID=A1K3P3_AZOSB|nr:hypothetical protein [Azoarcus olearius]CAL93448.1 conserved hypothetical protein [Azoarcus olearius]